MTDASVSKYRFSIDPADVDDLRSRLAGTRWPEPLPGDLGWTKGTPVSAAQEWSGELAALDVAALVDELNAMPQFTTVIDGQNIHFIHVPSERAGAIPLLALHGWPGTAVELLDLVGPLTAPATESDQAFSVVIPSHPGIGLSGRPSEEGWGVDRTARAYAALMARLGYDRYVVQGGDHGAVIGPHIGRVDPDHVRGIHVNAATIGFIPMGPVDEATRAEFTALERHRMEAVGRFMSDGNGYNIIQATRPQTIGYGLEDSPAALLTWIVEKVHDWTHSERALQDPHYRKRHLTDVLLYWVTRTATSAANTVYSEYDRLFADPQRAFANSGVPTGVAVFAEDVAIRMYAEQANTIVHWSDFDFGGHFAALEQPEALIADLRTFIESSRTTR